MAQVREKVGLADLREGMRVVAITKLDQKFAMVDSQTLAKLRDTLPGARYVVERDRQQLKLDVYSLKAFDTVVRIEELPKNSAFAKVGSDTATELERLGFYEFTVLAPSQQPSAEKPAPAAQPTVAAAVRLKQHTSNDPAHVARVSETRQFLESLSASNAERDSASQAVEEAMGDARRGKLRRPTLDRAVSSVMSRGAAPAMRAIAGLKASDQTYAHCVDMSVIFSMAYEEMARVSKARASVPLSSVLVAGFMHDIGKSSVPKEILESQKRFDPDGEEMRIMRGHAEAGAKILSDLNFGTDVVNVAQCHHVKQDTSLGASYPDVSYDAVRPVTRLVAIADVYQALIGKRSYKKNWVPAKAVRFLMDLKGTEFDERYLGIFLRSVGIYPVGSLVRLNTGHVAFVVRNDSNNLERPVVVVVEDANGNRLSQNDLVDLMIAPDLSITDVLDHYEHFSESPDQPYEVFSTLRF